jgi:hypothetical protein
MRKAGGLAMKFQYYYNANTMARLMIFSLLFFINNFCLSQNIKYQVQITNPNEQVKLIGQLAKPLGTTLTVQGIIVDISSKGHKGGLNMRIQSISDSLIQEQMIIPLSPYFGEFGDKPLPKLQKGFTYQLRVYETGEFIGIPSNAYEEADIILQTKGFHFQNRLIVLSGEKIMPIKMPPDSFVGQVSLISGVAKNENDTAYINTSKGKLRLIGFRRWTASEIGKLVEVYGKIEQTETRGIYNVRDSSPRLVNLEDQIGMTVKLRGKAISLNGYWWFNYRGTDIYVEKMEELPNWTVDNHFRPMEITGILEQATLPRLDQITLKTNRDSKLYYIVRKPSWTPIEKLLEIEGPLTDD